MICGLFCYNAYEEEEKFQSQAEILRRETAEMGR